MKQTDIIPESITKLPKIALVVDYENWAFHNYARQISKWLQGVYDFRILTASNYKNPALILLDLQDCDLIHFFWRADLFRILNSETQQYFTENGQDYSHFLVDVVAKLNLTTSVYDHLYLSENEIERYEILFNALCVGYTTCSERLRQIYSNISDYPEPDSVAEDGVDFEIFQPRNLQRFENISKELVIGWAGNSKWGEGEYIDHKGLETIIKPAIKSLNKQGYKISGLFADRQEKWIPHIEMVDYYNSIDVYVCASDSEGKPDPVLEAMACGLPVISTNVGVVPQVFGKLQQNYIMPVRNVEEMKTKLQSLLNNRQHLKDLSDENLISIKTWSWENQSKKWDAFFKKMLALSQSTYHKERIIKLKQYALQQHINYLTEKKSANQLPTFQSKIADLEGRINYKDSYNQHLETKIVERDESYTKLVSETSEKDKYIKELVTIISEKDQNIKELTFSVSKKDNDIKEKDEYLVTFSRQMQSKLALIEESKFWKARNMWFGLKNKIQKNK